MTQDPLARALRDTCATLTAHMLVPASSLDALLDKVPVDSGHRSQRRRLLPIGAALVSAAAVSATVVLGLQLGDRTHRASALPGTGVAASGPFPSSEYFLATRSRPFRPPQGHPPQVVIVRASDHTAVATIPPKTLDESNSPVLSPDGSRIYATWSNPSRMGYYDLTTGKTVVLDSRHGILTGLTISADGKTLAYEWVGTPGSPETSTSIVIRDLDTEEARFLPNAPAGPQVLSMALSPDGAQLAVVPTTTTTRPLLLVRTTDARAFGHPARVTGFGCATHSAYEPRWTVHGLYALDFCGQASDLVTIDPKTHATRVFHRFNAPGITAYTVIPTSNGELIAATGQPTGHALLYDPQRGWKATAVTGIDGLAEITSD